MTHGHGSTWSIERGRTVLPRPLRTPRLSLCDAPRQVCSTAANKRRFVVSLVLSEIEIGEVRGWLVAVRNFPRGTQPESGGSTHRPTSRPADSLGARESPKTGGGSAHALSYTLGTMSRIRARGKSKFGFPMAPPHKAEAKNKSAVRELNRQVISRVSIATPLLVEEKRSA